VKDLLSFSERISLLFVHNCLGWYRIPLFRKIGKKYKNSEFWFTRPFELPTYGAPYKIKIPSGFNVKLLKPVKLFPPPYPHTVSFGIIRKAMRRDFDIIIWGENIVCLEAIIVFFLCKIFKIPFIAWVDDWNYPKKPLIRRIIAPIPNLVVQHADACITHGVKHKERLIMAGVRANRIFFAHDANVIEYTEQDMLAADEIRKKYHLEDFKIISYIGGFTKLKSVHLLITAFSYLKQEIKAVKLLLCGEGPEKPSLQNLIKELSLEEDVIFLGWLQPNKSVAPLYLVSDVIVVPSIAIWSLVMNEAMSMGKPIVATTACSASYDLIKNGLNGFVTRYGDTKEMCLALKKILTDPALQEKMGEASKKLVKDFWNFDVMAIDFEKCINTIFVSNLLKTTKYNNS